MKKYKELTVHEKINAKSKRNHEFKMYWGKNLAWLVSGYEYPSNFHSTFK